MAHRVRHGCWSGLSFARRLNGVFTGIYTPGCPDVRTDRERFCRTGGLGGRTLRFRHLSSATVMWAPGTLVVLVAVGEFGLLFGRGCPRCM